MVTNVEARQETMQSSAAKLSHHDSHFDLAQPLPPLEIDLGLLGDRALITVGRKLAQGQRLDLEDGLRLMTSRDLSGLGHLAHQARLAKNGLRAYYVRNRHINYSNVCANGCAFCAFWREPGQKGAQTMTPAQAAALAAQNPDMPLEELHVVGACNPGLDFSYYPDLLRALGQARPQAALKAFTAVEIDHMAQVAGLDVCQVLDILRQAGLKAMPGGGAEVFAPRVRRALCPSKPSGARWLEVSGLAHQMGLQTNATMLYGHIETAQERVEHLLALREQQDKTGGFSAFIPLAFHPANTKLAHLAPTTALDDLRVIATSRLMLDNFPHIKAYWVMLSPKLAQVALGYGADDLDGTIVEERITHEAGANTAVGLTEAELRQMIEAAGCAPVRRDAFYNAVED